MLTCVRIVEVKYRYACVTTSLNYIVKLAVNSTLGLITLAQAHNALIISALIKDLDEFHAWLNLLMLFQF